MNMSNSRREFLRGLAGASLLSLTAAPPRMLLRAARAAEAQATAANDRILVFVQLSGGNDGLNTVVPFEDDVYFKSRPGIQLARNQLHTLQDGLALHPGMDGMASLFRDGHLNLIQGVGYPNPDRSHFRSMDIWHTARMDPGTSDSGWLGRSVERIARDEGRLPALAVGQRQLPLALVSSQINIPAILDPRQYRWNLLDRQEPGQVRVRKSLERVLDGKSPEAEALNDELDFLKRTARATYKSARRLRDVTRDYRSSVDYPGTMLGQRLKYVAQMIAGDLGARIYFLSLDGFDTHSRQADAHAALLTELSTAVTAFFRDLSEHGLSRQVAVATYSEFGRRVHENGSLGTDHGAASQMFLVAEDQGGVTGAHPSLTDLEDGDLKFHTDFRQVYATLLSRWLKLPAEEILGARYDSLPILESV